MDSSRHEALISSLVTLYSLLADQQAYPASNILLPVPPSRTFDAERIDEAAAVENGFGYGVIDLTRSIPCLDDTEYKIAYETFPLRYLDQGAAPFELASDPTYQGRPDLMANDDLVLTGGTSPYGWSIIYNVKDQTIKEWSSFSGPDHPSECPAVSMNSSANPLYRIITRFLTLETFLYPSSDTLLDLHLPFEESGVDPSMEGMDDEEREHWSDMKARSEHKASFRNVFIESGWDVDAVMLELGNVATTDSSISNQDGQLPLQTAAAGIQDAEISIWVRLERARQAARRNFRVADFRQRKEVWIASMRGLIT